MPELPISFTLEYPYTRTLGQAHRGPPNHFAMWIVSSEPTPTFS